MRAILLAAGRGLRLKQPEDEQLPKCLLRFAGITLLERHLRLLHAAGITDVVLGLGFRHELVSAELDRLDWRPRPTIVLNERFELGSMLTVHRLAGPLTTSADVLLMDADVLYDERIMAALTQGPAPVNRVLLDRNFEAGEEPVKLCIRAGVPVELRKRVAPELVYDTIGESVGFFRFGAGAAARLAALVADYVAADGAGLPHEEAIRDLLLEGTHRFDVADVTGSAWIEVDFPVDVKRAAHDVLPLLRPLSWPARTGS